jgi:hypothetical protein
VKAWVVSIAAALLSACGYVGPPMPPTLDIPARVTNFRAWEAGDNIEIEFVLPAKTTEDLPLTGVRSVELRIEEYSLENKVVDTKLVPLRDVKPGPVTGQVPARDWIGKTLLLAVRATGPKGKASEWSNPSALTVIQPLTPPSMPKAQSVARGVELNWTGTGPRYRIFRAEGDGPPQTLAESKGPPYVDETTGYGTRYRYMVQAVAADNQWSLVSEAAEITPSDTFPPAVPEDVSAVPTPQSIELAWTRNTEADFRGYNIFRSVENGAFVQIAALVDVPAYSDSKIEAGKRYRYAISAVDLTGNESRRSEPVDAAAQ